MSFILALTLACAPQSVDLTQVPLLPGPGARPVLYDEPGDGRLWALGASWKASFGADGVQYVPLTGSASRAPRPVRFRLSGAVSAGRGLDVTAPASVRRSGDAVELDCGALREVWHLDPHLVEQTFVFDALPARGDLVLTIELETDLARRGGGDALHLEAADGAVSYGRAIAVDASGRRAAVERVATSGGFELRVAGDFLADAVLPLVIDPVVSNTFTVATATRPQRNPDAAFGMANVGNGKSSAYMVVWEELAGGVDVDLLSAEVDLNGAVIPSSLRVINSSTEVTQRPKVAFDRPAQMWMVAYERSTTGGAPFHIHQRRRELNSMLPWYSGSVVSSNEPGDKRNPDIGGFEDGLAQGAHSFTIVWEQQNGTDWDIKARQAAPTGGFTTAVLDIATGPANDRAPDVSRGAGAPFYGFHWHNIVWTREPGSPTSTVHSRRITTNGGSLTAALEVSHFGGGYGARATETLAGPTLADGTLPFTAIYSQRFGTNVTKYSSLVGNSVVESGTNLDFYEGLAAATQAVAFEAASIRDGVVYAYTTPVGGHIDLRLCAANHVQRASTNNYGLGLGERDVHVGTLLDGETEFTLATHAEGGGHQDQSALFWTSQGVLRGVIYDGPGTILAPILGVQDCVAVANSTGERGWIAGFGRPDVIAPKTLVASDLPPNSVGYLLVAPEHGSALPANSVGRLCLSGPIGRYRNQLQSSAALGTMTFDVRPYDLPSPTGPVAAQPGENWYFQVWHRDALGGQATSNFTNALQITFE